MNRTVEYLAHVWGDEGYLKIPAPGYVCSMFSFDPLFDGYWTLSIADWRLARLGPPVTDPDIGQLIYQIRRCDDCGEVYPLTSSYFHRDHSAFRWQCRWCRNDGERHRYQRRYKS